MKNFLFFFILFMSNISNAQSWEDIKIGSNIEILKDHLIQKGYTINYINEYDFVYGISGNGSDDDFGYSIQFHIAYHPITKIAHTALIHIYQNTISKYVQERFDKIDKIISNKYPKIKTEYTYKYNSNYFDNNTKDITASIRNKSRIMHSYAGKQGIEILLLYHTYYDIRNDVPSISMIYTNPKLAKSAYSTLR